MSGRASRIGRTTGVLRLARVSLLAGAIMLLSSCIVAEPPENRSPVQTRPALDVYTAAPPTSRVMVVHVNDLIKIAVPLRSEDAGEALRGVFLVDYNAGSMGLFINSQDIAASTYADEGRQVTLDWIVPSLPAPACHLLSLIVAHDSSFKTNPNYQLNPNATNNDATIINWWINDLDADTGKPSLLGDCPTPGIPTK